MNRTIATLMSLRRAAVARLLRDSVWTESREERATNISGFTEKGLTPSGEQLDQEAASLQRTACQLASSF
jgi:hypothetical protein